MKQGFIEPLMKNMIKHGDFMPLIDEEGKMLLADGVKVLVKNAYRSLVFVELIDADRLSCEEIKARLGENAQRLDLMDAGRYNYIFELFVFEDEPAQEKIDIIAAGQVNNTMGKKMLKCMSISLSAKKAVKHFKVPLSDFGVGKLVKSQLQSEGTDDASSETIEDIVRQKQKEYEIEYKAGTPIITYALIAINILVWAAISLYSMKTGRSYDELLSVFGAKENLAIINGEYWRLLTPVFLHAGVPHLVLNCYSLYAVGVTVEKFFGHFKFIGIYLFAGILGNIASFMLSSNPGVGASGSIFGLMGALLYFGLEKPALFKVYFGYNIAVTIVINLVYGFSRSGIDNYAHIGGLIGGFLATGAIRKPARPTWYLNRYLYLLLAVVVALGGLAYGFNNRQNKIVAMASKMQQLYGSQKWSESEKLGEEILALEPGNNYIKAEVLWNLALSEGTQGKLDEGLEHAKLLQQVEPGSGHYLSGLFYFDLGQYDNARQALLEAKKLNAKYEGIDKLLNEIDRVTKGE